MLKRREKVAPPEVAGAEANLCWYPEVEIPLSLLWNQELLFVIKESYGSLGGYGYWSCCLHLSVLGEIKKLWVVNGLLWLVRVFYGYITLQHYSCVGPLRCPYEAWKRYIEQILTYQACQSVATDSFKCFSQPNCRPFGSCAGAMVDDNPNDITTSLLVSEDLLVEAREFALQA